MLETGLSKEISEEDSTLANLPVYYLYFLDSSFDGKKYGEHSALFFVGQLLNSIQIPFGGDVGKGPKTV